MTNLEGRVLLRRRAIEPPPGAWSDLQILHALAERLGFGAKFPDEPREVFEELRRASAGGIADYAGIDYERIVEEDGVFWPCPRTDHPGTPRMFLDRFATEDGRARFHPIAYKPAAEEPDDAYPLFLTTGRVLSQYQSGVQTRRVDALLKAAPEPFVEVHPALAQAFGICDGEEVGVGTRRGSIRVKARITHSIRQDTLFIPFHWGGKGCANLLTNPALDPTSRMPEFKVCAARLEAIKSKTPISET
jgi:assimilatory nitrate reductase catalytic subunit